MAINTQSLLLDINGRQVPQWYDAVADLFRPLSNSPANSDTAALINHVAASNGVSGADQINSNGRGLQIGLNIAAGTGTLPTLQLIVEGKDAASGVYYTIATTAAIAAVAGFNLISLYPGLVSGAVIFNQVLPRVWRIRTVIGGTTPAITATIGASIIV